MNEKNKSLYAIFLIFGLFLVMSLSNIGTVQAQPIAEDDFEDNDTSATPATIVFGNYTNLCQADDDWYSLHVQAGVTVNITLKFNGTLDNIDLEILNLNLSVLALSNNLTSDSEFVSLSIYDEQDILIHVYGNNTAEAYDMIIVGNYPIQPTDDYYEENDFIYDAYEFAPSVNYENLVLYDPDYYKFYITPDNSDGHLDLFLNTTTNITATIFDSNGTYLAGGEYFEMSYINLNWTKNESWIGEWFYLEVIGGNYGLGYNIFWWQDNSSRDDYMEENDAFDYTWWLDIYYQNTWTDLYQYDSDYYSFNVYTGDKLDLEVVTGGTNYMGIEIYDFNRNPILFDDSYSDGILNATFISNSSDPYYLRVFGANLGEMYSIFIQSPSNGTNANDDWAEENDDYMSARWLDVQSSNSWFSLVQFDDDYYMFDLNDGDTAHIEIQFDGSYHMELYDINPMDGEIIQSVYHSAGEGNGYLDLWITAFGSGTFKIAVKGDNLGVFYDLYINLQTNSSNTDDWAEENDFPSEAYEISGGDYSGFVQNDDDYFKIKIYEPTLVIITLKCEPYSSLWVTFVDLSNGNEWISDSSTQDGILEIQTDANFTGTIGFVVRGDNTGNWYDLSIKLTGLNNDTVNDSSTDTNSTDNPLDIPFDQLPGYPIQFTSLFMALTIIALIINFRKKKIIN